MCGASAIPAMQVDANLGSAPIEEVGELAAAAERLGFGGVWVTEMASSPFTLMTRAAASTTDVDIGTGIVVAFPRSPMVTAYTAWDLQSLSDGRFILGLGTQVKGHIERRFGLEWDSPGPRLRDYVGALRAIWNAWATGDELDYHSSHYDIDLCPPAFRPEPIEDPEIPVYIAGVNEYNLRLAGELCDGLHVHPLHSPAYIEEEVVPNIETGARRAGRDSGEVTLATSVLAAIGDDKDERAAARESVREQIAFYASTRTYRPILDVHGWADVCGDLHELSVNGEWDRMPELVTDEMLAAFSIEGSWDEVRGLVEDRYTNIDRVSVYRPFRDEPGWQRVLV